MQNSETARIRHREVRKFKSRCNLQRILTSSKRR